MAISFRTTASEAVTPRPTLSTSSSAAIDGERISVSGAGFAPGAAVYLRQCHGEVGEDWDEIVEAGIRQCDEARGTTTVAGKDGSWTVDYLAFADIQTSAPWAPCDPCVLVATDYQEPPAVVPLVVSSGDAPIRPQVRIVPAGPYDLGQQVRLEGTGFQSNASVGVAWCGFRTAAPELEIQGDPAFGHTPCARPAEPGGAGPLPGPRTGPDGAFVLDGFPLPSGAFGAREAGDCADPSIRCGLAEHPGEGALPVFVTVFELR